jgi:hypothetical protein
LLDRYSLLAQSEDNEDFFTLKDNNLKGLPKPLGKPLGENAQGAKDIYKDKDKELDKDKKECAQNFLQKWPTFDHFWEAYDKKRGDISKVRKKWDSLTQADKERIMEAMPAYKLSTPDKLYRKDPATYLNNRSWEDEIIHPPGQTTSDPTHPSRYDQAYERKLQGQEVTNYHAHLKRLGWEKNYSPGGGTTWRSPLQDSYRHAN